MFSRVQIKVQLFTMFIHGCDLHFLSFKGTENLIVLCNASTNFIYRLQDVSGKTLSVAAEEKQRKLPVPRVTEKQSAPGAGLGC